jgi:hypothetical protein
VLPHSLTLSLVDQVFFLVFSNVAMLPAVWHSVFAVEMPILATTLISAMTASSFYHLCDMEAYCLFDFSYQSLQVLHTD